MVRESIWVEEDGNVGLLPGLWASSALVEYKEYLPLYTQLDHTIPLKFLLS